MTLDEARQSLGREVVYSPYVGCEDKHKEIGTITSVSDTYVFVRYGTDTISKSTKPENIQLIKEVKVKKILKNRVQCLKCNDIIESVHVHDFKVCSCKSIHVDGGREYLKRGGDPSLMKDMSVFDDTEPSKYKEGLIPSEEKE